MLRKFPKRIKRVVVKVGSSVIATYKMKPKMAHLRSLVDQITAIRKKGIDVILVSSGAIVLGMGELATKQRPADLASLQAVAALGQSILMERYKALFKRNKTKCGQLLLTWDDFEDRKRYNNARNTLNAMADLNIIPIVNENDTISTEEIKFGDNDKLSAMVASLVGADLLLILSDVEGFYDTKSKDKKVFNEIKEITEEIESIATGTTKKNMSKGGMKAKLQAIKVASHAKIPCIIANGETENVLLRILKGEQIGTLFVEKEEKLLARKHWISFGAKPKGTFIVDQGAKEALLKGGRSLLLPGVESYEGDFKKNDVIVVCDPSRHEIARGIVNYSVSELNKMNEKNGKMEAIHYDNLVLSER